MPLWYRSCDSCPAADDHRARGIASAKPPPCCFRSTGPSRSDWKSSRQRREVPRLVFHSLENVGSRFVSLRQSHRAKHSLPACERAKIPNKHGPSRAKLCTAAPRRRPKIRSLRADHTRASCSEKLVRKSARAHWTSCGLPWRCVKGTSVTASWRRRSASPGLSMLPVVDPPIATFPVVPVEAG